MKQVSRTELLFFILAGIFGFISLFQLTEFLLPYYEFWHTIIGLMLIGGIYIFLYHRNVIGKFLFSQNTSTEKQNILSTKYVSESFLSLLFASIFIISIFVVMIAFISENHIWGYIATGFLFFSYTVLKYLGLSIKYTPIKSELSDMNALRFFILSFAFFIIILHSIFEISKLSQEMKTSYYILSSLLYAFVMYGVFYFRAISLKHILQYRISTYRGLSIIALFFLGGFLILQNIAPSLSWLQNTSSGETELPAFQKETPNVPPVIEIPKVLVSEIYDLSVGMRVGSEGTSVISLQTALGKLGYFTAEASGDFDESTRLALVEALKTECAWPESTQGIFGPQAKECIDNLEIPLP